jgi:FkbM family methyltransferase
MAWRVAFTGAYDRPEIELVAPFIQPSTVVLDIGASLGLWTVQLAALAADRGATLHAFEPNVHNVPWIERNIALNAQDPFVTVHPVGLGEHEGKLRLDPEAIVGNGAIKPDGSLDIAIRRLDHISFPGRVSLIKLDVEGFEPAILRGARHLLARDRPVIFGEFSPTWLAERGEDFKDALSAIPYDAMRCADGWLLRPQS